MILTLTGACGSSLSLDFRERFGELVELECFQFVTPPGEFRLIRGAQPLQDWQAGNDEMYDLQHPPLGKEWSRDSHWFINDLQHRNDVMTSGVLARDLVMETRGLGICFVLHVWPRESTVRRQPAGTVIDFS